MKKSEIKKRMQDGFSELSPDMFETIWEAAEEQRCFTSERACQKSEESFLQTVFIGKISKYAASACAVFVLLCICIFGVSRDDSQDISLLVDVNPSMRIVMDDSFRVKRIEGINADGKDFVEAFYWNRKESVYHILDSVLEDVVKASYLHEDSGILVTICVSDSSIYEDLERKMGECIDTKLEEMDVRGVITAFQQGRENSLKDGRDQLVQKLEETDGLRLDQAREMSVIELIRYCRENASFSITCSPESDRIWNDVFPQNGVKKDGSGKEEQEWNEDALRLEVESAQDIEKEEKEEKTPDMKQAEEESAPKNGQKDANTENNRLPAESKSPTQTEESVPEPDQPASETVTPPQQSPDGQEEEPDKSGKKEKEKDRNGNKNKKKEKDKNKNKNKKKEKDKNGNKKKEKDKNNNPNKKNIKDKNGNSNKDDARDKNDNPNKDDAKNKNGNPNQDDAKNKNINPNKDDTGNKNGNSDKNDIKNKNSNSDKDDAKNKNGN